MTLYCHQQEHLVEVEQCRDRYRVFAAGSQTELAGSLQGDTLHLDIEGHRQRCTLAPVQDGFTLYLPEGACHFREVTADTGELDHAADGGGLRAPMNGTVIALLASPGEQVAGGVPLLIMEAMKMEHTIRAPGAGTVQAFHFGPGDLVDGGAVLLDFTPGESG
jgi:3-methylcrotonyl-CoA carboxylase alpha subunit